MRGIFRNALVFVATAVCVAVLASTHASALTFTDIQGKWCTGGGILQFEPGTLTVVRSADGGRSVYTIRRYEYADSRIVVWWVNSENEEVSTEYVEFSPDRQRMVQLQAKDGPRRELLRC